MHEIHIDIVQLQLCEARLECAQWVPVVLAPAGTWISVSLHWVRKTHASFVVTYTSERAIPDSRIAWPTETSLPALAVNAVQRWNKQLYTVVCGLSVPKYIVIFLDAGWYIITRRVYMTVSQSKSSLDHVHDMRTFALSAHPTSSL